MKSKISYNLYVDTNVLANYFTGQQNDITCLNYIFANVEKNNLFTSSLAMVQFAQVLQSNKGKQRKKFSITQVQNCFEKIITKFSIMDLTIEDINKSFGKEIKGDDVEDRIHYIESKKFNCFAIITNDIGHYNNFLDVRVFSPTDIPYMKKYLKQKFDK